MSDVVSAMRNKTVMVVDDSAHHRRIFGEVLRAIGVGDFVSHGTVEEAARALQRGGVGVIITDWLMEPVCGLTFARDIRRGVYGEPVRRIPIILSTASATPAHLGKIRNAGPDEYLLKPISAAAMLSRFRAVLFSRRIFVESQNYIGPCRRRRWEEDYAGPLRRLFDTDEDESQIEAQEMKRTLARARVDRAVELARTLTARDRQRIRDIFEVAREIQGLSQEAGDTLLKVSAESLAQYIVGVGASPRFQVEVVQTHCEAMQRLASLPNAGYDLRQKLSEALCQLTARKMRA